MGGKEDNAWMKDIGESGTTDHKFRTEGDALKDRQHQAYAEEKAAEREEAEGLIPKRGENPVLAEVRARNAQSAADRAAERGEGAAGGHEGEDRTSNDAALAEE